MKVREYFEEFIENYFCELDDDLGYCPMCRTGLDYEEMEGLSDCEDYDDYDYDELKDIEEDVFKEYFESNGFELEQVTCPQCGNEWQYFRTPEDSIFEEDHYYGGNHIQILKDEYALECPRCGGDVTRICNGFATCKCGEIFSPLLLSDDDEEV